MTTLVNQIINNYAFSSPGGALTDGMAVIVAILVIALLIEKIVLDSYEGKPIEYKTRAFAVVIAPLLFSVVIIGILRIAQVLML